MNCMNKKAVIIFGISKVAEIVWSSMTEDRACKWEPVAFTVDRAYMETDEKFGLPVVAFEDLEKSYMPQEYRMIVAVGYHDMNKVRAQKCREAEEKGYELISYVHSKADISGSVTVGKNTIILNAASIGPFSNIGNDVCIFNNATISHHVTVEDHVWITSGSVVGGNSSVGDHCFLGINSTVAHNVQIGSNNFIGTNAVITKNTKKDSVYIVPDTPRYRLSTDQFIRLFRFD